MGTWGVHSFENDDAVEWAAAYCEMGLDVAASTLHVALEDHSNNRLSSGIAARAVAAVEAVAFALGRGSPEAARLFERAPAADPATAEALLSEASEALSAVAGGSELARYWKEAGADEHAGWAASLSELGARLGRPGAELAQAPQAVRPAPAAAPPAETDIEEVLRAIDGLSVDIAALREEMVENFARLAQSIDGGGR